MNTKKFLNREILFTSAFVFFQILSFVYNDPWENIFIGLAFISLFFVFKSFLLHGKLKEVYNKRLIIILITVVITCVFTIFFLFTQRYKIKYNNIHFDRENDEIAVMLVYNGENPMYDISIELSNITLRDKKIDILMSPFLLNDKKNNYKNIGKSQHKENIQQVASRLQSLLPKNNKVYIGYLYDKKYIEETLIDIVQDGCDKIIVVPIFLTEDESYYLLQSRINKMKLFNRNIQIRYTNPLWYNETIVKTYLRKINNNITEDEILNTGIVMIGKGENSKEDNEFITSIKQNIMFRKKINDYLVEILNFPQEKIKLAWDAHIEPKYTHQVKALLEYGVGEIICIYIDPQVNYIQNNIILEHLKKDVELPEGVKIKVVDGFLNSYDFIYEIRNKIQVEMLKTWN